MEKLKGFAHFFIKNIVKILQKFNGSIVYYVHDRWKNPNPTKKLITYSKLNLNLKESGTFKNFPKKC